MPKRIRAEPCVRGCITPTIAQLLALLTISTCRRRHCHRASTLSSSELASKYVCALCGASIDTVPLADDGPLEVVLADTGSWKTPGKLCRGLFARKIRQSLVAILAIILKMVLMIEEAGISSIQQTGGTTLDTMAARGNGLPGPQMVGNVGRAAPAAGVVGQAAVPAQPRLDIETGLRGSPPTKSDIAFEIHAQVDETRP